MRKYPFAWLRCMHDCLRASGEVPNGASLLRCRACKQEGTLVHNNKEIAERAAQHGSSGSRRTMFTGRKDLQAADPAPLPHPNPNGTATVNVQPTVAAC